ncbi:MAG: sigma-70 family RNA polymerase sigma factor [Bacteroidia bacterium]|nr:sigma-70 family RNA polymerase sigma factor [Bacteroidia bacterium]
MTSASALPWHDELYFRRLWKALAGYCLKFFPGRPELAEDAATDAMISLYEAHASGAEIHNVSGWLRTAAKNRSLNEIKKIARFAKIDVLNAPDEYSSNDERGFYIRDEIAKRLTRLTKRELEVVKLHLAGFSRQEIASQLDITSQRISDLLTQARKKLRSD